MEIEMKLGADRSFEECYQGGGAYLCPEALRNEVSLPKKIFKIYAVFKKKSVPDSFRIDAPARAWHGKDESLISEIDEYLMTCTRKVLAEAYNDGFRYVRIEY